MPTGRIKWFDADKGRGIIIPRDGREEVVVHLSDLRTDTKTAFCEGNRVQYEERQGPSGTEAVNVRSLEDMFQRRL